MSKYEIFDVLGMRFAGRLNILVTRVLCASLCALVPALVAAESIKVRDMLLIADDGLPRPVNVFAGGRYFGTLSPGDGTVVQYCAYAQSTIHLTFDAVPRSSEVQASLSVGSAQDAAPAYQVYQSAGGPLRLRALVERPVLPTVHSSNQSRVALSRYRLGECPDEPASAVDSVRSVVVAAGSPAPAPALALALAPAPELKLVWQYSGLEFGYGRSVPNALQKADAWAIGVIREIEVRFRHVNGVRVVGHSDPEGTQERKSIRSLERADFIRSLLQRNGLKSTLVETVGVGDRNLVVTSCASLNAAMQRSCNAPNRRIEVFVEGVARGGN